MLKEKIKALVVNQKDISNKKRIENIVVFIVILIVTVIAINSIWSGDKNENKKESTVEDTIGKELAEVQKTSTTNDNDDNIEKRLESILSKIDGVGDVRVLITYSQSSEVVAMYNENNKNSVIEEKDSGGGTRTTTQTDTTKDIVYKEENGDKTPVTR